MSRFPARRVVVPTLLLALALGAAAGPSVAADETAELSRRLIALRGEVENLNAELELVREEQRTTLAGLAQQKAELEANLKRQEVAAREARDRLARFAGETAASGVAGDALKPVLLATLDRLVGYVGAALPFRTEERLATIAELRTQIENGTLPPHRAANRVWGLFEDELRITRETGLYKQTAP
jgi:hypothetical protein